MFWTKKRLEENDKAAATEIAKAKPAPRDGMVIEGRGIVLAVEYEEHILLEKLARLRRVEVVNGFGDTKYESNGCDRDGYYVVTGEILTGDNGRLILLAYSELFNLVDAWKFYSIGIVSAEEYARIRGLIAEAREIANDWKPAIIWGRDE